jgi:hypothetical protein
MARLFTCLLVLFISSTALCQTFEGRIIYQNAYKSKLPNVTDAQFSAAMGSTQAYYIKDGSYKSVVIGAFYQWAIYDNNENKLYTKFLNSDTLLWNNGSENDDEVLKVELNKGVTTILGYLCDELILTCDASLHKYYFNASIGVDPKLFEKHKFGNWYAFVSKSKALPLKIIMETNDFVMESTATLVSPMKLTDALFQLPKDAATAKSPY